MSLVNARYGALNIGVPVSWAAALVAHSATAAATRIPPQSLRRMTFSLYVFGDHAHPIVDDLQESATYGEATDGFAATDRQKP